MAFSPEFEQKLRGWRATAVDSPSRADRAVNGGAENCSRTATRPDNVGPILQHARTTSAGSCRLNSKPLFLHQLLKLVFVPTVADDLSLDDPVRLRRLPLVLGRTVLQIAEYFHSLNHAPEHRVNPIQMRGRNER